MTNFDLEQIDRLLTTTKAVRRRLDLTRPGLNVPVARMIAPGLQVEPSELVTPRLAEMVARTGGAVKYTGGVALV